MPEPINDPELTALESSLSALRPLPDRLNRDQLMFEAGRLSARRRSWAWPAATGALAASCMILSGALVLRAPPAPAERIVYVPSPAPAAAPDRTAAPPAAAAVAGVPSTLEDEPAVNVANLLSQRGLVLRFGADALPDATLAPAGAEGFLADWPADTRARPKLQRTLPPIIGGSS